MADQQIDDLLKDLEAVENAPAEPVLIERTLSDGTKVSGKDHDELYANIENHFKSQKEVVQPKVTPFPAPVVNSRPAEAPPPVPSTVDVDEWAGLLQKGKILEAQALLDNARYGSDPVAKIKQLENQIQEQQKAFTYREIRSWQKANKDIDLKTHGQMLETLLRNQGLGITEENLDLVRDQARQYGWLGAPEAPRTAPEAPPVAPKTSAPKAKTGGGAELIAALMDKLDDPDLTPDQRNAMMAKYGLFMPGSESKLNSLG